MARRRVGRSRSDISGTGDGHDQKLTECERETTDSKEDDELTEGLDHEIEWGGTFEGQQQIRECLGAARRVAHDIYGDCDGKLVREQDETHEFSNELQGESDTAGRDLGRTERVERQAHREENRSELRRVEGGLRNDIEYLERETQKARERAAQSERIRNALASRTRR